MSFAEDITADLAVIFDPEEAGAEVVYTPKSGAPLNINAVVLYGQDLDNADWGTALEATARAWVRSADIAEPEAGDVLNAEGVDWTVIRRLGKFPGYWKLQLTSDVRPAFGRRSNA